MENTPIQTVELKNGLKLEIFDASHNVAADRYKVILVARIDVDVNEALTSPVCGEIEAEKAAGVLGPRLVFEQKSERFFVDEPDKETVFAEFLKACLKNAETYFAHPDFAARFVLRTYRTRLKDQGHP